MIEQLCNDLKTIPRPSKDDTMKMLYESHKKLEKDYSIEFKRFWVTSAINGTKGYLVSEKL